MNNWQKYFRYVAYLVGLAILFQLIMVYVLDQDKVLAKLKVDLQNDVNVVSHVGTVENLSLTKRTSVNKSESSPAYKVYDILISGTKSKALFVIRVDTDTLGDEGAYSITRVINNDQ